MFTKARHWTAFSAAETVEVLKNNLLNSIRILFLHLRLSLTLRFSDQTLWVYEFLISSNRAACLRFFTFLDTILLHVKLIVRKSNQELPRRSIAVLTTARHTSSSWARWTHSTHSNHIFRISILILLSHLRLILLIGIFPSFISNQKPVKIPLVASALYSSITIIGENVNYGAFHHAIFSSFLEHLTRAIERTADVYGLTLGASCTPPKRYNEALIRQGANSVLHVKLWKGSSYA